MKIKNWVPLYLFGVAFTGLTFVAGGGRINDSGELGTVIGLCLLWPLTWSYVAIVAAFLFLFCGWRGGPIW